MGTNSKENVGLCFAIVPKMAAAAAAMSSLSILAFPASHHVKLRSRSSIIIHSGHHSCLPVVRGKQHGSRRSATDRLQSQNFVRTQTLTRAAATGEPQEQNRQYYMVTYDYVPDIVEKRKPWQAQHNALAKQYLDEGTMVVGGAAGSPVDGALLIFHVNHIEVVQKFVDEDPYVQNDLVTKVDIRPYFAVFSSQLRS